MAVLPASDSAMGWVVRLETASWLGATSSRSDSPCFILSCILGRGIGLLALEGGARGVNSLVDRRQVYRELDGGKRSEEGVLDFTNMSLLRT